MSTGSIPSVALLLRDFYKKSDDPEDHEGYADFFTPDATVIMGLKTFKGRQGNSPICRTSNLMKRNIEFSSWNLERRSITTSYSHRQVSKGRFGHDVDGNGGVRIEEWAETKV